MAPRKFDRYMIHVGVGAHPKLSPLTDSEWRAHVGGVLAVAALAPIRGCLLVGDLEADHKVIAKTAGVSPGVARNALAKLEQLGVVQRDLELGCLRVHDWDDFNPQPAKDPTGAKRQADYRRRRVARNGEK